jgi:YD repeat-containing protein
LTTAVVPGSEVTFNFIVRAPYSGADEPPPANFRWQMVQDGVQWFGDLTQNQSVTIISNYHPPNGDAPNPGPFSDLFASRIAPQHRTGQPGEDLLSGNYNWGLGLVDLAGRAGLNLNLGLSYNSQATWTKVDPPYLPLMPENFQQPTSWTFDADRGSPSAGFRLGFPSIQGPFSNNQASTSSYLMLMPSGARVELRQVDYSNAYESVDTSYLQLLDGGNGSLLVRSPDGSQLAYWSINSEYRCTEVKDRNGNYLTIKYDPINGEANPGRMTSIIDTLGRTINFNYDVNYRLQSITQLRNGQPHVWATFGYSDLEVLTNFVDEPGEGGAGPGEELPAQGIGTMGERVGGNNHSVVGLPENNTVSVLTQVGLDDGSRYNFDYTTWAQVYQVHHYAADGLDCPRFTQRQDWVENWNGNEPAVTTFEFDVEGAWGQATFATGTAAQVSYREYSTQDYEDWTRGLVTRTEIRDHTNAIKKTTITAWERDFTGVPYAVNPLPKRITVSDSEGNRRQTSIEYTSFGLPAEVFEQGPLNTSDWAILRRTHTDYDLSPAYVNRHIFGLVQGRYLFAPDAPNSPAVQTLMGKTTYEYDVDTGICNGPCADYAAAANSPSIVQHDAANYGAGFMVGRGVLTRVRRWDANDEWNESKRIASSMHYDSLGSPIRSSDPLGHQTTTGYADQFSVDGVTVANSSVVTLAYPTVITDPDGYSANARHHYDLGQVTRQQDPKGAAQTRQYDAAGRVTQVSNAVNGAHSATIYPSSQTIVVNTANIKDLDPAHRAYAFTVFDGAGRVRAIASDFPNSTGHYSGQFTLYDKRGRPVRSTNPTEMTHLWVASGDDEFLSNVVYGRIIRRRFSEAPVVVRL